MSGANSLEPLQKDRRAANPAFGTRKLKLGTFQTNLDSGCVMSDLDGRRNAMAEMMISGWGGFALVGTKEQIVDGLVTLSQIGLDGVLLSWPRYIEGMREFRDVTYPLLKQTGLRD